MPSLTQARQATPSGATSSKPMVSGSPPTPPISPTEAGSVKAAAAAQTQEDWRMHEQYGKMLKKMNAERDTLLQKLGQIDDYVYSSESIYLQDLPNGIFQSGLECYTAGRPSKRRGATEDVERIFSRSSLTYMAEVASPNSRFVSHTVPLSPLPAKTPVIRRPAPSPSYTPAPTAPPPVLDPNELVSRLQTPEGEQIRVELSDGAIYTIKDTRLGPRRTNCDRCRVRRVKCKHRDEITSLLEFISKGQDVGNAAVLSRGGVISGTAAANALQNGTPMNSNANAARKIKPPFGHSSTFAPTANMPMTLPGIARPPMGTMQEDRRMGRRESPAVMSSQSERPRYATPLDAAMARNLADMDQWLNGRPSGAGQMKRASVTYAGHASHTPTPTATTPMPMPMPRQNGISRHGSIGPSQSPTSNPPTPATLPDYNVTKRRRSDGNGAQPQVVVDYNDENRPTKRFKEHGSFKPANLGPVRDIGGIPAPFHVPRLGQVPPPQVSQASPQTPTPTRYAPYLGEAKQLPNGSVHGQYAIAQKQSYVDQRREWKPTAFSAALPAMNTGANGNGSGTDQRNGDTITVKRREQPAAETAATKKKDEDEEEGEDGSGDESSSSSGSSFSSQEKDRDSDDDFTEE